MAFNGTKRLALIVSAMAAMTLFSLTVVAGGASGTPDTGSITGRVFLDENADAVFKECDCDCGLEDIPVRLYRDNPALPSSSSDRTPCRLLHLRNPSGPWPAAGCHMRLLCLSLPCPYSLNIHPR